MNTLIDDKKVTILKTATTLFAQNGYAGVGIRKIAEESGCNISAISYYFGGKENLYAECFKLNTFESSLDLSSIFIDPDSREDFDLKLKTFCVAFSDYLKSNSDYIRLAISELSSQILNPEVAKGMFTPVSEPLKNFLQKGIEKGILKDDLNVDVLGRIIMTGIVSELMLFKDSHSGDGYLMELTKIYTGNVYN
jgi:AcrR family transcriptional regulator